MARRTMLLNCRVPLPKGVTVAQARRAVTEQWPDYVEVYMDGFMEPNQAGNCPQLTPKWGGARLSK